MQTMTRNQAQTFLSRAIGATFVSLVTCTETKMRKGGRAGAPVNPFHGQVLSVRKIQAQLNYKYDAAVERQLEREINAERAMVSLPLISEDDLRSEIDRRFSKGTSWYNVVTDEKGRLTPFCEHKDTNETYVCLRTLSKGDTIYVAKTDITGTTYLAGDEIPVERIEVYFPKITPYKNQGTEKKIQATTLKLNSIRGFAMNGTVAEVFPSDNQETIDRDVLAVIYNLVHARYENEMVEA